jgi:phosphopantothenoylcysteine decarboxylase/phosphopantothenate--cysteine ligase
MEPRRVLLVVTGGIAAYKTPELARTLIRAGHSVRCVLTRAATHFVSPMVLQTLTGERVRFDLFDSDEEGEIDHIALADWAELVVIAPATANSLAKLATGLADDLATAILLATRAQILLAPAMNVNMWRHPATQENVARLTARGIRLIGPEAGELACGWHGDGRMSEPADIAAAAARLFAPPTLEGEMLLVTAGGTREPIDAVRSVTNRSSGRMGFAIATEAARRGAEVLLIAGVTALDTPPGVQRRNVESASEMYDAVLSELDRATIVVKAAAVADFSPVAPSQRKIKKEEMEAGTNLTLELAPTRDILAEVCRRKGNRVVVGFAAESHDVLEAAQRKLARKGCDLLVANDVSREDAGFDVDTNAVMFVWPGGDVEELPLMSKDQVASKLVDRIEKLRVGSQ